jgi:hypothetical protein
MAGHILAIGGGGFLGGHLSSPLDDLLFELGGKSGTHVVYTRLVAEGFPAGIACDDGAAAHYRGRDLVEVVADRPGARGYRVSSSGIEPLAATRLLR